VLARPPLQAEEDSVTERFMGDDVLIAMRNLSRKMCKVLEDRNDGEGLEYWSARAAAYQHEVERRGLEDVSQAARRRRVER
jgi:hypothetical protein